MLISQCSMFGCCLRHESSAKSVDTLQGVFKRIYECLLEDGVVRPEQIVCPPHLPSPQDMQLVRAVHSPWCSQPTALCAVAQQAFCAAKLPYL